MEPIISPWVFYLIGIVPGLAVIAIVTAIIAAIVSLLVIPFVIEGDCSDETGAKWWKRTIPLCVFCALLFVLLPTQTTLYKMIAASYITPDNIGVAVDGVVATKEVLVRDAISIIQAIANGVAK